MKTQISKLNHQKTINKKKQNIINYKTLSVQNAFKLNPNEIKHSISITNTWPTRVYKIIPGRNSWIFTERHILGRKQNIQFQTRAVSVGSGLGRTRLKQVSRETAVWQEAKVDEGSPLYIFDVERHSTSNVYPKTERSNFTIFPLSDYAKELLANSAFDMITFPR